MDKKWTAMIPARVWLCAFVLVLYSIFCFQAFKMHFLDDYIKGAILETFFIAWQVPLFLLFIFLSKPLFSGAYRGAAFGAWILFFSIFLSLGFPVMGLTRYYEFSVDQMRAQFQEDQSTLIKAEQALREEKRLAGKKLTFFAFNNYLGLVIEKDGRHAEIEASLEEVTAWYQNYFEENDYEVTREKGGSSTLFESTGEVVENKGYYLTVESREFIIVLSLYEEDNLLKLLLR